MIATKGTYWMKVLLEQRVLEDDGALVICQGENSFLISMIYNNKIANVGVYWASIQDYAGVGGAGQL